MRIRSIILMALWLCIASAYLVVSSPAAWAKIVSFAHVEADGSLTRISSYTNLDLRVGLQTERWTIELYGKNLTDEMGITSVGTANTIYTGVVDLAYIRPKTYGLSVGVNF